MIVQKARWWLDSVRGLIVHIAIYKEMLRAAASVPSDQRSTQLTDQLRAQEGMIGHCLLHVLVVHPIGSGSFL